MNKLDKFVSVRRSLVAITQLLLLATLLESNAYAAGGQAPAPTNPVVSDLGVTGEPRKPVASFVFRWDPVAGASEYAVRVAGCTSVVSVSGAALPSYAGGRVRVSGPPYAVRASGCRCSQLSPRVVTLPVPPMYTKQSSEAVPDQSLLRFPKPCPQ